MCYLSEWDVYDLFVISSIWAGGAAPSPPTPVQLFQAKPSQAIFRPSSSRSVNNSRLLSLNVIKKTMPTAKKHANPTTNNQTNRKNWNTNEYQEKTTRTNEKGGTTMKKTCNNQWKTRKAMQEPMKNNEQPCKNQWNTMKKPMKTKEKLCKNQWKPRRNNENKCIHHTYPAFMYHLYSCLNDMYDITFHIVRIHSWCVLIHYICYLSEGGHEEPKK